MRSSIRRRLKNADVFIIYTDVKELIESYYKDKIKPENPDYRVHGWESEAAARKRFGALFAAVDLNGKLAAALAPSSANWSAAKSVAITSVSTFCRQ